MIIDTNLNKSLFYSEILNRVNRDGYYYESWLYENLYEYIINFIKALSSNEDIILLDKDFSSSELEKLGFYDQVEKRKKIGKNKFDDITQLFSSFRNSISKIYIYTSGTTGAPKKVTHSVNSLTRMTRIGEKYDLDVWGLAYNPTHMAGLQVLFQSILNSNTIIYLFDKSLRTINEEIEKYGITHISATPTFYRMLVSDSRVFNNVKRVTLGGEKSNDKLLTDLRRTFPNAKINNIYASTEFGSLFVTDGDVFRVPDSLKDQVKVIDNELFMDSTLLPDQKLREDDWFPTGDIVELISSKPLSFKFISRKNTKINVGGYMVNPTEVEDAIRQVRGILDTRVYSRENSVLGNILCAKIVLENNSTLTKKDLKRFLNTKLQEFKIPAVIEFTNQIDRTRSGKIKRI